MTPPTRLTGRVIRLVRDKGFGFIKAPDDREYFFHRSAAEDFDRLTEGAIVTFAPSMGEKGLRAEQVQLP